MAMHNPPHPGASSGTGLNGHIRHWLPESAQWNGLSPFTVTRNPLRVSG